MPDKRNRRNSISYIKNDKKTENYAPCGTHPHTICSPCNLRPSASCNSRSSSLSAELAPPTTDDSWWWGELPPADLPRPELLSKCSCSYHTRDLSTKQLFHTFYTVWSKKRIFNNSDLNPASEILQFLFFYFAPPLKVWQCRTLAEASLGLHFGPRACGAKYRERSCSEFILNF